MDDTMQIGTTREINGMRIHLYHGALEVTDIRDAGKRGKSCARFNSSRWPHSGRLYDAARAVCAAPTFEAAREAVRSFDGELDTRDEQLRAVDVLPAADAHLTVVFRYNGIQVGGTLIRGWFSRQAEWRDGDRVVPAHVTFYARSYHSDLLRRLFAGEVQNGTDTMTDYFEEDKVRFGVDHPRYAEALAASEAGSAHSAKLQERRMARAGGVR